VENNSVDGKEIKCFNAIARGFKSLLLW